jgi:hypothetical protein
MFSVQAATAGISPIFISPPALNIIYCVEANWCAINAFTDCGAESFMERGILARDAA